VAISSAVGISTSPFAPSTASTAPSGMVALTPPCLPKPTQPTKDSLCLQMQTEPPHSLCLGLQLINQCSLIVWLSAYG
jgi:hypothetical protein